MRRLAVIVLSAALMALGACASSKPCPAYAKAMDTSEVKG